MNNEMISCPACNKPIRSNSEECPNCGVIISKWLARDKGAPPTLVPLMTVPSSRRGGLWIWVVVVAAVFIFYLNHLVKEKTKKMDYSDVSKLANRLALKSSGMDNPNDFLKFVEMKDVDAVKKYLSAGVSPNIQIGPRSPLRFAIMNGDIPMFDVLVAGGADVNARDSTGQSVLSFAIQTPPPNLDRGTFIRRLVKVGADSSDPQIQNAPQFISATDPNWEQKAADEPKPKAIRLAREFLKNDPTLTRFLTGNVYANPMPSNTYGVEFAFQSKNGTVTEHVIIIVDLATNQCKRIDQTQN